MYKKLFIFLFLVMSGFNHTALADTEYVFKLNVFLSDAHLKDVIESKIEDHTSKTAHLRLSTDANAQGSSVADLYIFVEQHKESKVNPEMLIFSIAHTSKADILNLTREVFREGVEVNDTIKQMTYNLITAHGGMLKYLNVVSSDNFEGVDTVIVNIMAALSARIGTYQ